MKVLSVETVKTGDYIALSKSRKLITSERESAPIGLLEAAKLEFFSFCEEYKIKDFEYCFARLSEWEGCWQVEFFQTEDATGPCIQVYEIYYSEEAESILQSCTGVA
jgi:hypothetical protein